MLVITPQATDVVRELRVERGLPDEYVVRVFPDSSDGQQKIRLEFAEGPVAGDQSTESEGARLFVAAELADALADSVIDVQWNGDDRKLVLQST